MEIEIWSDVVCPWCWIGTRHLQEALATFPHADEVEVVYRSFLLDPSAPVGGTEPTLDVLARKYGGGRAGAEQMVDRVEAVAAEAGLLMRLRETVSYSTVDAHRVLHLALEQGGPALQRQVKEAFLAAHFTEARNLGDHAVLRATAVAAGLDGADVDAVLASDRFTEEVFADVARAQAYGATGVPFTVVDRAYGVPGAQPAAAFTQVLERAWADAHPAPLVTTTGGTVCDGDGCAVPER